VPVAELGVADVGEAVGLAVVPPAFRLHAFDDFYLNVFFVVFVDVCCAEFLFVQF
jgi:hypothetical protein